MTILQHTPSATSAIADNRHSPLAPAVDRRAYAQARLAEGKIDAGLAALRAHLADDGATLTDLALFLEVSGRSRPYGGKWLARVEHAVRQIRETGTLGEGDAARTGQLLLLRQELAAAALLSRWMERQYPNGEVGALFLADFYQRVGEPAVAFDRLFAAAAAHPDSLEVARRLLSRLVALGRGAEAVDIAQAISQRRPTCESLLALARVRLMAGAPSEAAEAALQAIGLGAAPDEVEPLARGLAEQERADDAARVIAAALDTAPRHAGLNRLKAEGLLRLGADEDAAVALRIAVASEPSAELSEALIEVLLRLGRIDEARSVIAPGPPEADDLARSVARAKLLRAEGRIAEADKLDALARARAAWAGTTPIRPHRVRLAGLIGPGGLGDFMYQLLALCSLGRQFSDASVTLLYKNDFSYKRDILRFCPDLEDARDIGGDAVSVSASDKGLGDFRHHMFFNHAALSPTLLSRLQRTATLAAPPEDVDRLTAGLIARGLDPDRWFVAMHYRQNASFRGRGTGRFDLGSLRDVDPTPFHQLAASIIADGGQVVRLGHPGMPPPPPTPGYIDLADGGLPLQLFAVSKARFMVACDSGPTSYATAFKTPVFKTNAICEDGAVYASDLILAKNVIDWRGDVLSPRRMFKGRLMILKRIVQSEHGFRLVDNTLEQLRFGVDRMMARTAGGGWRADVVEDMSSPPEAIAWPAEEASGVEILDAAHLSGRPVQAVDYTALKALLRGAAGQ